MYTCPVCFYDGLGEPPVNYNICDCCGTEFGNDDEERTHRQLRQEWVDAGAKWFFGVPPMGWNPWSQLLEANVSADTLPYRFVYSFVGGCEDSISLGRSFTLRNEVASFRGFVAVAA